MILYKYRPLNHHTVDSIFNNFLYFSKPSSFNDPFDCRFSVIIEGKHYEKVECAKRLVGNLHLDKGDRKNRERKFVQSIIAGTFDYEMFYKRVVKSMDTKTVCCLSKVADDLLMWAHYADGHKGLCLIYDVDKGSLPDCILEPVTYQDNLIQVNLIKTAIDYVIPIFTTKAMHWKYEKEFRLINNLGTQMVKHQPKCLKGIIFGCKVDTKQKTDLIGEIKAKGRLFTFQQTAQSRERYELNIAEL